MAAQAAPAATVPEPDFGHLVRMTDTRGTFEHALFSTPRPEHGYCTDDMARVLVVAARQSRPTPAADMLARLSLRFLTSAVRSDGRCRNRLSRWGVWEDVAGLDDCWGRTLWGLGTAVSRSQDQIVRDSAAGLFGRACGQRSSWPRAMAFAALGAAEVLAAEPTHHGAIALLTDAADAMPRAGEEAGWPWPEPRLTYANAVLPEAMIAAGSHLGRPELLQRGLDLLAWLLDRQTAAGHLSVTPVGGWGPGDSGPEFDQQPIEVAALADACARAAGLDASPQWPQGVARAVAWFLGDNDVAAVMWDPTTGGGFDGLGIAGANRNQGTESTLALLATLQHARSLQTVSL
jgi:hypothetical protein